MNSQETSPGDSSESVEPTLSISSDNADLSCTEVRSQGSWDRMDGKEIRWQWTGPKNIPLNDLLKQSIKTHPFPSVTNPEETIHLCKLADGGIISYNLETGHWLHTLNTATSFRRKIFELNLVPLESLRYFLVGCDHPGEIDFPANTE